MLKRTMTLFACLCLSTLLEAQFVDQVERGISGEAAGWTGLSPLYCWEFDEVISDQPGQFSETLDLCSSTVTQVSDVSNEFSGALIAATAIQPTGGDSQEAYVGAWYEVTFTLSEATEFALALDGVISFTGAQSSCASASASLTIRDTMSSTNPYALETTLEGSFTDATSLTLSAGTYQLAVWTFASSSVSGIFCSGTAASSLNFSLSSLGASETFRRGDANLDGVHNIVDAIFSVNALLFSGSPQPMCSDAADANDNGVFDIADVIFSLNSLFIPTMPALAYPGPDSCGSDPTIDTLDCSSGCP